MLKLKNTPRLPWRDLVMTSPQQEQIGQYCDPHRVRAALLVPSDLMLAQSQARFEFPIDELNRPTLLVHAHHLSRGQLRQIGHQDFCVPGAHVTPFFTQYHGDVTDMTQPQALAINPKGLATLTLDVFGNPGSSVQVARQMGDEMLDHFLIYRFPGASNGKDKAPAAFIIGLVAIFDHLHVSLGAIGRVATDDHPLGPTRRRELAHHLATQSMFVLIAWVTLGQNEAKAHREAIAVPSGDQQHEADTENPGVMLAFSAFLSHAILRPAFVGLAAVTYEMKDAVAWRRQRGHQSLSHPADKQMDVPIGGFEQP